MKISKVYNNNVISTFNKKNEELVVMGRGLAFQKKPGDFVDESKIEKIFTLNDTGVHERLKILLAEIPVEYMELTDEIIRLMKHRLNRDVTDTMYLALMDHLHFALTRHREGFEIKNFLLWEIKRFYKDEFMLGKKALEIIEDRFHVKLPEDEAGFLAMHMVSAGLNEAMPNISNITKLTQDILNIVKYHFNITINEDSLNFYRFVTHLKFFAQRMYARTYFEEDDTFLYEAFVQKHGKTAECTEKISKYIQAQFDYELQSSEKLYLSLHIHRVVDATIKESKE